MSTWRCCRRRNLISPPTDSQGPTDAKTMTSFGPHSSKASYSGEISPPGLSAAMSGRAGTNLCCGATSRLDHQPERKMRMPPFQVGRCVHQTSQSAHARKGTSGTVSQYLTHLTVTALPAHFMPLARGLAPSMKLDGQPFTQRPSMRAYRVIGRSYLVGTPDFDGHMGHIGLQVADYVPFDDLQGKVVRLLQDITRQ